MTANELYRAGKLTEAVAAAGDELKAQPLDVKKRTTLFELLCFAGDYDRAEKHLEVLAKENQQAGMAALLYRAALHAERTRQDIFIKKEFPKTPEAAPPLGGTINGAAFKDIEDADPRIGSRLELLSAGAYLWIPFGHIISIEMQAPKRLRDLLWAPVIVKTGPEFRQAELGESLIPVLYPFSYKQADDELKLGRKTEWLEDDGQEIPFGQKMFLIDGKEYPLLELRKLEFQRAEEAAAGE